MRHWIDNRHSSWKIGDTGFLVSRTFLDRKIYFMYSRPAHARGQPKLKGFCGLSDGVFLMAEGIATVIDQNHTTARALVEITDQTCEFLRASGYPELIEEDQ